MTHHHRHGKDHHRPDIWRDNRKMCDLRHEIEMKRLQYENEKQRLEDEYYREKEKTPEPTPMGGIGSSQQELLQTILDLKRKVNWVNFTYRDLTSCRFCSTTLCENDERWFSRLPGRILRRLS